MKFIFIFEIHKNNRIMYKKGLLISLIIFSLTAKSQAKQDYDFIVKLNNDTVYGYVNFTDDLSKQMVCSFTALGDSVTYDYTPYEIKSYQLNDGVKFVSFTYNRTKIFVEQVIKNNKASIIFEDNTGKHIYRLNKYNNLEQYRSNFFELFGVMPIEPVTSGGINLHLHPFANVSHLYVRTGVQVYMPTGNYVIPILKVPLQLEFVNTAYAVQPKISIGVSYFTPNNFMVGGMVGINLKLSPSLKIGINMDLDTNFKFGFYSPSMGLIFTI